MMPFLCTMVNQRRVITHSDRDGFYVVVLKPREGLVAAFGLSLLSCDPPLELVSARRKVSDPLVFSELKKIEDMATKNQIAPERVLLVDCSCGLVTPDEVGTAVREGFERGVAFDRVRGNALWPGLGNRVGLMLTDVLIDDVWGKSREQFCGVGDGMI